MDKNQREGKTEAAKGKTRETAGKAKGDKDEKEGNKGGATLGLINGEAKKTGK